MEKMRVYDRRYQVRENSTINQLSELTTKIFKYKEDEVDSIIKEMLSGVTVAHNVE